MKTTSKAVVKSVSPKWWTRKKLQVGACLLLVGLLTAVYFLFIKGEPQKQIVSSKICSNEILQKAAKVLTTHKKLQKIAEDVEAMDQFEKDINCVYIAMAYYINIGHPQKAREYYDKFTKHPNFISGANPLLGNNVKTNKQLEADIKFLDKIAEQVENNTQTSPNPWTLPNNIL